MKLSGSNISPVFVAMSTTRVTSKTGYARIVTMENRATQDVVNIKRSDIIWLIKNWTYYTTGKDEDLIRGDTVSLSPDVKRVLDNLIVNIREGSVTPEYIVEQNEQFGLARSKLDAQHI